MELDTICEKYSLSCEDRAELSEYLTNRFAGLKENEPTAFEQLDVWKKLASLAGLCGAAEVINQKVCRRLPVDFKHPDGVRLKIYTSPAGELPIIYADDEDDFEALVTNIVHKGERPENIGKTGAAFVSGQKTRLIILSSKPYSNVPASELSLDKDDWAQKSLLIRRSHECTHFYTKQVYGVSNNILHDELMADFVGLYDTFGFYRAEWFLKFLGIIPGSGDRLGVYTAGLSQKVTQAVTEIVESAAHGLEKWSHSEGFLSLDYSARIREMVHMGITGMADLNDIKEVSI